MVLVVVVGVLWEEEFLVFKSPYVGPFWEAHVVLYK